MAVLFGGRSTEHEVSISSATAVVQALDPTRYESVLVAIDHDGGWSLAEPEAGLLPDAVFGHADAVAAFPTTARGFDLLAPHFTDAYRVIAVDARGHGDSDWDDGYWWQSDVRDIGALMEWIGQPVDLLGHSRGGGTAMDAAVAYPHCVKKLINIDGFGPPEGGFRLPGEDAW